MNVSFTQRPRRATPLLLGSCIEVSGHCWFFRCRPKWWREGVLLSLAQEGGRFVLGRLTSRSNLRATQCGVECMSSAKNCRRRLGTSKERPLKKLIAATNAGKPNRVNWRTLRSKCLLAGKRRCSRTLVVPLSKSAADHMATWASVKNPWHSIQIPLLYGGFWCAVEWWLTRGRTSQAEPRLFPCHLPLNNVLCA